jgi:hypothetical protein
MRKLNGIDKMDFGERLYTAFDSVGWQALKAAEISSLIGKKRDLCHTYLGKLKAASFLTTVPGTKPQAYKLPSTKIPMPKDEFVKGVKAAMSSKAKNAKDTMKLHKIKTKEAKESKYTSTAMTKTTDYYNNLTKLAQEARETFIKAAEKLGLHIKIEATLVDTSEIEKMFNKE